MNNVSIFERQWTDLVFEGRNQAYGAYQLRRESNRTTLIAFFFGMLITASVTGIFMLISLINAPAVPAVPDFTGTRITPVDLNPVLQRPKQDLPPPQHQAAPAIPVPTEPENIPEEVETTPIDKPSAGSLEGAGSETSTGESGPAGGAVAVPEIPGPETVKIPASLDRQPAFPGGLESFYVFVGKNFRPVETEGKTIRVFLSFVIEKDGTLSDIKILRDPGFGAGKEAIRVLRSLKTKWEPGMINGKPVRTSYTMPITIKPAE